ncbi:MAG: XdhC family protein [Acidimicrobiales bacterium]
MKELLEQVRSWLAAGEAVGLARVVELVGSGVRPAGATIAVTGGEVLGSASGGCVEGQLVAEARAALAGDGRPRVASFGCSDDEAFDVGLSCGGLVRVLFERLAPEVASRSWLDELIALVKAGKGAALVEVIAGPGGLLGQKAVLSEGCSTAGPIFAGWPGAGAELGAAAARDALADLAAERSVPHCYSLAGPEGKDAVTVFVDSFPAPPEMVIVGAASFTAALTAQAKLLGYHVVVCDARAVFASPARFPLADEVVVEWPDTYLKRSGGRLSPRDAICVLTHDPKFDLPAIVAALRTGAGYVGIMGSRRTQAERWLRLEEAGVTETGLRRLRGPIGLDLGAQSPEETAVSIVAEIISMRSGHAGGPLATTSAPIHSALPDPAAPGEPVLAQPVPAQPVPGEPVAVPGEPVAVPGDPAAEVGTAHEHP